MKYIEAFSVEYPSVYYGSKEPSVFLAGGITNCRDWQSEVVEKLKNTDLVLINPRRKNWDVGATDAQIWEYDHLKLADMILFWFPCETLCPITLFEYGKWLGRKKPLFVGCDPECKRIQDVVVQTKLERPKLQVFTNIDDALNSLREKVRDGN